MSENEQRQAEWASRIEAYRSSGLTMAAWCEANSCTREQLKYWLYKKKSAAPSVGSATPPRFVPLAVTEKTKNAAAPTLTVHIGAAQIPLQSGFDPCCSGKC